MSTSISISISSNNFRNTGSKLVAMLPATTHSSISSTAAPTGSVGNLWVNNRSNSSISISGNATAFRMLYVRMTTPNSFHQPNEDVSPGRGGPDLVNQFSASMQAN